MENKFMYIPNLDEDNLISEQGPQGPQKLSSLKSFNIQNFPPIPGTFTPAAIISGKPVKNVQIDP